MSKRQGVSNASGPKAINPKTLGYAFWALPAAENQFRAETFYFGFVIVAPKVSQCGSYLFVFL
jgi:hypothetical protein